MNGIEIAGVVFLAVVLFTARFLLLKLIKIYMYSVTRKDEKHED